MAEPAPGGIRAARVSPGAALAKPGLALAEPARAWLRLLLVLLSVVLTLLALPGQPYPLLAFVALLPLGLALHGAGPWPAAALGFTYGFFGWLGSVVGLATAARSYLELSPPEAMLYVAAFCAYSAVPYALFAYLYGVFQWLRQPFGALLTAAFFSLVVCLFPSPMPMSPEAALFPLTGFIQVLDLGGRPLLLFLLALINWSLVILLLRYIAGARIAGVAIALLAVLALVTGYGQFRLSGLESESQSAAPDPLTVATLQPGFPSSVETSQGGSIEPGNLDVLLALSQQVLEDHPQVALVLWPETPERIDCDPGATSRSQLLRLARRFGSAFIVSCAESVPHRGDYNTAMLVSPEGQIRAYHKQRLFPFAEFLPAESVLPALRELLPGAANYLAGKSVTLFPLPGAGRGFSAICYEVLFPGHVWKFVQRGGELLVNPVNDDWFGDSRITDFMVAAAVFRAVEFRLPVLRVSNSSATLLVRSNGQIVGDSRMGAGEQGFRVSTLANPAARHRAYFPGRWFAVILALICLVGLIAGRVSGRAS